MYQDLFEVAPYIYKNKKYGYRVVNPFNGDTWTTCTLLHEAINKRDKMVKRLIELLGNDEQ